MNKMTIALSSSTEDVVGGSSQNEPPDGDYVEADPMHRYIRYDEVLGRGAFKTVYRGFDEVDGIEIAWNQIRIDDVLRSPDDLERLYSEVHLLKSLKHANIIKFYSSWVDDQKKTINIITELFTSGSLRQYRKKHKNVDMKAVKNWARQILCGLSYLHGHNPPVIHRDLKCDNIFVNGNHGEVKIGDLGLATVMQQPNARSVIGTPEFMAPELYDEEYNELVDIYSFGMCLLEMITLEYPYSECNNAAQIYRKVTNGVKPLALGKVKDPQVRVIIEKCLSPASERLSAKELLKDPFFQYVDPREIARHPLKLPAIIPKPLNKGSSSIASDVTTVSTAKTGPLSMDIDFELKPPAIAVTPGPVSGTSTPQQTTAALEFERSSKNHDFKLKGEKTDSNTITLVLRIADARGPVKNVHFMFYLDSDTALAVAGEMVEHLEFSSQDVTFIAEFIDFVIMKLVPGWKPSCVDKLPGEATHVFEDSKAAGQVSFGYPWDGVQRSKTMKNEGSDDALSTSESGSPCAEISSADGSVHQADHGNNAFAKAADMMSQTGVDSSSSLATLEDQELFGSFASDISAEYTQVSTLVRDSTEELDPDMNLNMSVCNLRDISNIPRIQSNASLEAYDADEELKSELVSIEMQYQQWFRELAKQQKEALASARKRWEAKKKLRAG